ncbi:MULTISPECIES: MIP/aquaporin family protein [Arthrobacter]|uniref:Porin n=1 Tax=Arthrobacter terricola TaxID=2547396 RepID=A0A4V2ZT68_9MICC|nr:MULTISPECIES: aquaporin [Arthrobacter]MBT8161564.1 aquaporin [Arthrobacter sp. GN70]TDF95724.1 porin [Arthrobacter terricola]
MTTTAPNSSSRGTGLIARACAEALGTLFLVVIGLGVLIFINPQAVPVPAPLASGLAVAAAMLAFGYVSGGHFNPAVTVGHVIAGRLKLADGGAYLVAQVIGALAGALAIYAVVRSVPGITDSRTVFDTATSGFGTHSSFQVAFWGVALVEVLGSALLVTVFLSATARRNPARVTAPIAVGLTVAVLMQLGQSTGNLAFNPARATASAIFSSSWAAGELWLFWVGPLVGAAIVGLLFRVFGEPARIVESGNGDTDVADEAADDEEVPDDETGVGAEGISDASVPPVEPAPEPEADPARDFFDGKRR